MVAEPDAADEEALFDTSLMREGGAAIVDEDIDDGPAEMKAAPRPRPAPPACGRFLITGWKPSAAFRAFSAASFACSSACCAAYLAASSKAACRCRSISRCSAVVLLLLEEAAAGFDVDAAGAGLADSELALLLNVMPEYKPDMLCIIMATWNWQLEERQVRTCGRLYGTGSSSLIAFSSRKEVYGQSRVEGSHITAYLSRWTLVCYTEIVVLPPGYRDSYIAGCTFNASLLQYCLIVSIASSMSISSQRSRKSRKFLELQPSLPGRLRNPCNLISRSEGSLPSFRNCTRPRRRILGKLPSIARVSGSGLATTLTEIACT